MGEVMSLGVNFEVSEAHARPSYTSFCLHLADQTQTLSYCHTCLTAAMLPAMMGIDSPSKTVSKPPVKLNAF